MPEPTAEKQNQKTPLELLKMEYEFAKVFFRNNLMTLFLWGFLIRLTQIDHFVTGLLISCVGLGVLVLYGSNNSKLYLIGFRLTQEGDSYCLFDEEFLRGTALSQRTFLREISFFLLIEPFFQYLPFKIGMDHGLVLILQYRWVLFMMMVLKNSFYQIMTGVMMWIQKGLLKEMKDLTVEEQTVLVAEIRERVDIEDEKARMRADFPKELGSFKEESSEDEE